MQANDIASGRFAVGDVPGIEVRPDGDRHAGIDEPPRRGVVVLHQEPGRDRQERGDDRLVGLGGRGQRGDARVGWRGQVVRRRGAELGGQLRAAGRGELVGMQPREQPEPGGGLEDAPRLVGAEDAGLAEDVGEARPAVGRDARQLLVEERLARRPPSPPGRDAELGRDGVRAEPRRDDVDRALLRRGDRRPRRGAARSRGRARSRTSPRPSSRRGRASRPASAGRGPAGPPRLAARVAATVDRMPPPAARMSR